MALLKTEILNAQNSILKYTKAIYHWRSLMTDKECIFWQLWKAKSKNQLVKSLQAA